MIDLIYMLPMHGQIGLHITALLIIGQCVAYGAQPGVMIYIHVDVGCYSVVTDSLPTMLIG
jgi:hypothetical protein